MIDFTPLARMVFRRRIAQLNKIKGYAEDVQQEELRRIIAAGARCRIGDQYGFRRLGKERRPYEALRSRCRPSQYEEIRHYVERMMLGEADILWPGVCRNFAQSSGTSGGRSKYIPITPCYLKHNHIQGAFDTVAHYLQNHPESRMFKGKGLILGGSFANEVRHKAPGVKIGDLSATLIDRCPAMADLFRIPDKETALLADWNEKLPALAEKAMNADVTNLSGVPSWFMMLIKRVLELKGASSLAEVWPNLEVFFHGGISFEPYREEYRRITEGLRMNFMETYNASEGFFALQTDPEDTALELILDAGVFFEFTPLDKCDPMPLWEVEKGKVYEMVITGSNGLWRYRTGDTVRIESLDPPKIRIVGRTKSFINAFGEELMEDNAERAIAEASRLTDSRIRNYTAAPRFARNGELPRHQWLIEWEKAPADIEEFSRTLDEELKKLNSDYAAKRSGTIFMERPEITTVPDGFFDAWLRRAGSHKLGGQRKVPRLSNDRRLIEEMLGGL